MERFNKISAIGIAAALLGLFFSTVCPAQTPTRAAAWMGRQAFAVKNGGFSVCNKAEEHEKGYGLSLKYILPSHYSVSLGADKETFKDVASDNRATAVRHTVSVGHTF